MPDGLNDMNVLSFFFCHVQFPPQIPQLNEAAPNSFFASSTTTQARRTTTLEGKTQ
jgi:hypothetical protein